MKSSVYRQYENFQQPPVVINRGASQVSLRERVNTESLHMRKLADNWMQYLSAASLAWNRLSMEQLLETGGKYQQLVGLIEEGYALTRAEADRQVRVFVKVMTQ